MKKDFSIMKWFVFPILALGCAIGIGIASYQMFGVEGSVLYWILLACIVFISVILVFQTGNKRLRPAMIAAFGFETVGLIALVITGIVAVMASRELAGMREASTQSTDTIKAIGTLKSAKAQNSLVAKSEVKAVNVGAAIKEAESKMLWPLVFEVSVYFIGLMVLFGINLFLAPNDSRDVEQEIESKPLRQNKTARSTFLAANAPLRVSSAHTVDNGNGFYLSLSASGNGVSIRFRERGGQAEHVIRVPNDLAQAEQLESMDYRQLALWSLRKLKVEGKDSKPIFKKLEETL